jgi:hypothetical protein
MKLFAVACLASTGSAQSGDYDDRGITSDYYSAATDYYEYDEFGNKKNKNKGQNKWFGDDGGREWGANEVTASGTRTNPVTHQWDWAFALNCWPANIEADALVFANQLIDDAGTITERLEATGTEARNVELYPNQIHHRLAPQHVYGSYEITNRAHIASADATTGVTADASKNGPFAGENEAAGRGTNFGDLHEEDPVLRSGLGGLYQYGHDTYNDSYHNQNLDTAQEDRVNAGTVTSSRWTHYKQARHAGCLYEKAEWHYGYATYEQIFLATYYQGYGSFDTTATGTYIDAWEGTGDETQYGAEKVEPVWWHFFNAHILPNPSDTSAVLTAGTAATGSVPKGDVKPNDGSGTTYNFFKPEVMNSIPLVMANPAYEGLGYLNFIVEYKNKNFEVGQDYKEFIDSSPGLYSAGYTAGAGGGTTGFRGTDTYREINNCNYSTTKENQECTGWGENLGKWSGVHGLYYYDLYMGSWFVYPAFESNVTGAGGELKITYRTWVLYPFEGDGSTNTSIHVDYYLDDNVDASWENSVGNDNSITWSMCTWGADEAGLADGNAQWSINHDLAVSSFPHNNLGKDFRFNLRVLQGALSLTTNTDVAATDAPNSKAFFDKTKLGTNQMYRSYYFYKINQIDIVFPYFVAYALHHENRSSGVGEDTDTLTDDGLHTSGGAADWIGADDANMWGPDNQAGSKTIATLPSTGATATSTWCQNTAQCAARGQQWWNTMDNDIVHPAGFVGNDADGEYYKHMDATALKVWNSNPIMGTTGLLDDYQFMHQSMADDRTNIIPPVDLGTHAPGVNKHSASGGGEVEFHRIMGFIKANTISAADLAGAANGRFADWCDITAGHSTENQGGAVLERTCGKHFTIIGLMNTYDERRGQRGTYQEVWVQLQYALGIGGRDETIDSCESNESHASCTTDGSVTDYPVQSPHPYFHFMASEIVSIQAECNLINVNNPNHCGRTDTGPAEPNMAAYGGK